MSSIIKVDQIQLADGSTPTAGDLGLNVTGGVLQVVSVSEDSTSSYSLSQGVLTSDVISAAITPTSTTSKILITAQVQLGLASENRVKVTFYRNGSIVPLSVGDTPGNRTQCTMVGHVAQIWAHANVHGTFLDSPSSTSEQTYSLRIGHGVGETQTLYLNRASLYDDQSYQGSPISTLTLIEIAG
jgi:hypothetical protein